MRASSQIELPQLGDPGTRLFDRGHERPCASSAELCAGPPGRRQLSRWERASYSRSVCVDGLGNRDAAARESETGEEARRERCWHR